jgi:predicted GTPase
LENKIRDLYNFTGSPINIYSRKKWLKLFLDID